MLSALLAAKAGLSVILLEKKTLPARNSRAIGITPPSLEILEQAGPVNDFIKTGIPVNGVEVHAEGVPSIRAFLSGIKTNYPFVLALPQNLTETLLEETLKKEKMIRFLRGYQVESVSEKEQGVGVSGKKDSGESFSLNGSFVFGCDGIKSTVRQASGIAFPGARYRDTFVMADCEDPTDWTDRAHLFMTHRGSVESFPLPGHRRRFVLRTPVYVGPDASSYIRNEIRLRCGIVIPELLSESAYRVKHYLARTFCTGRIFLCGDAAHIICPVGGQNMNVGFADAELAVRCVKLIMQDRSQQEKIRGFFNRIRKTSATAALARAELMMSFTAGEGRWATQVRGFGMKAFKIPVLKKMAAGFVSMTSLPSANFGRLPIKNQRPFQP
jgi:2-polyprenyl-6-methoxyphenol hydroxylase-like FAD-dependent oxidoreductase